MSRLQLNTMLDEIMLICRICLRSNCNLYSMKADDNFAYETLTGLLVENKENLPPYLCSECARRLLNCIHFRTKILRAHLILLEIVQKDNRLTLQSLASIMEKQDLFCSNLAMTRVQTNHYDLEIKYIEKENDRHGQSNLSLTKMNITNVVDSIKTEKDDNYYEDAVNDDVELLPRLQESNIKYNNMEKDETVLDIKVEDNIIDRLKDTLLDEAIMKENMMIDGKYNNVISTKTNSLYTLQEDSNGINEQESHVTDKSIENIKDEPYLSNLHKDRVEWKSEREHVNTIMLNKDSFIDKVSSKSVEQGENNSSVPSLPSAAERQIGGPSIKIRNNPNTNVNNPHKMEAKTSDILSCDICNYKTLQELQLLSHLKAHAAAKSFNCDMCRYKTTRKAHLVIHIKTHVGEKPYSCAYCMKAFSRKSALQRHLRTHSGEKPFTCYVCNKTFTETGSLRNHLRIHTGEKPYSCKVCNREFSEKSGLTRHFRLHTGEKRHTCDICKKTFNESSALKNHSRVHTDERKYSCDICFKTFKDKRAVKTHLTTHSGVTRAQQNRKLRLFPCKECGKTFSQKTLLLNHLGTHSDEKPYSCKVCSKAFGYKAGLQKHMKVHSAREVYSCELCNKHFIEKDYLQKHLRLYCRVKLNM